MVIEVDVLKGSVESDRCQQDAEVTLRRYMEWAGSLVAFMLEKFRFTEGMDKIVMSGGAVASRF